MPGSPSPLPLLVLLLIPLVWLHHLPGHCYSSPSPLLPILIPVAHSSPSSILCSLPLSPPPFSSSFHCHYPIISSPLVNSFVIPPPQLTLLSLLLSLRFPSVSTPFFILHLTPVFVPISHTSPSSHISSITSLTFFDLPSASLLSLPSFLPFHHSYPSSLTTPPFPFTQPPPCHLSIPPTGRDCRRAKGTGHDG